MLNIKWLLVFCLMWLSGCNALGPPEMGPDGKPLPKIYKLKRQNVGHVKFRMLDAVNALRIAKGIQVLEFNSELNALFQLFCNYSRRCVRIDSLKFRIFYALVWGCR